MSTIFKNMPHTGQKGFTLVELLIVVIILAVLAAVVVPQFSTSTDEAKISALDSTLANMRASLDLYYQQHSGSYPGAKAATGGTTWAGTAGTGAAGTLQAFQDQMALYTNIAGQACDTKDTTFKYGPYLKKAEMPQNPLTENSTLVIEATSKALGMTDDGGAAGWKYNVNTGQFIANDNTVDPAGNAYSTH